MIFPTNMISLCLYGSALIEVVTGAAYRNYNPILVEEVAVDVVVEHFSAWHVLFGSEDRKYST